MAVTPDMVSMGEAARILGVSNAKIWRLVSEGTLTVQQNPLDRREKLIHRRDLERLRTKESARITFRSDGIDAEPVEIPAGEIKDWVRDTWHRS